MHSDGKQGSNNSNVNAVAVGFIGNGKRLLGQRGLIDPLLWTRAVRN